MRPTTTGLKDMTSVVSPVPTLSTGLSTGLSNIADLGAKQSETVSRLAAGSRLADSDFDRSTQATQVDYAFQIGAFQRLSSVVAQGQSLVGTAGGSLESVRTELRRATDLFTEFDTRPRADFDYSQADFDFQAILSAVETLATGASFNEAAILTRTSSVSIANQVGITAEGSDGVLNLTARNFDNRTVAQGGDGAFTVQLQAENNAADPGGVLFTATATAAAGSIVLSGAIASSDVGGAGITTGKTVVLTQQTAAADLASLTKDRAQIVLSLDSNFDAATALGGGAAALTTFDIEEDTQGGALIVQGRSAPVVDGAQDFQIQVAGSIVEALGLSGASLQDSNKYQAAVEAVAQAFDYLDLAIADVEGAQGVLQNAARAISLAIDNYADAQGELGDFDEASALVSFVSTQLGGEYAERSTSIAALNSQATAALTETASVKVEIDLLEGLFPMDFVDFLNDTGTLGLITQLSVPEQDYVQAIRAGGALSNLGVPLPADVIESNPQQLIDGRQAIRDLAESVAAIVRPNVPNYVSRLD